jgi:hypothetical protein
MATFAQIFGGPIAVVGAVLSVWWFFADYRSHTEFKVARADMNFVYLKVWNTGRQPSALVGYRLRFDKKSDKEVVLTLRNSDAESSKNVIASGAPVDIAIALSDWKGLTPGDVRQLAGWDSTQRMTLFIDVQESWDDAGEHHVREDHFLSARIAPLIRYNWGY